MILTAFNVVMVFLLTIAFSNMAAGLLKFIRAIAMMKSLYLVSQNMDSNERSRYQYDFLSGWLPMATRGSNQIAWSIIAVGVIIMARLLAGAVYAYL